MKQACTSERRFINLLLGCVVQLPEFLMDKNIHLENETRIAAHCNSKIMITRRHNCWTNERISVSQGFINLMYFNPCLFYRQNIVTQMVGSHSFCKSFWSSFFIYLYQQFIWQLEKGLGCTAVSHLQWM